MRFDQTREKQEKTRPPSLLRNSRSRDGAAPAISSRVRGRRGALRPSRDCALIGQKRSFERSAGGTGQEERAMSAFRLSLAIAVAAVLVATASLNSHAQQSAGGITVGDGDLGGVVRSAKGPEAGVWVIAETTDLPTKFAKIVVTDDQGRYVLPELPKATYSVWVRGYGLVDSPKVRATPGKILDLTAVTAPTPAAAAEYYPAQWWYSMMKIPDKSLFPGTGPKGNGMATNMRSQAMWLANIKSQGCGSCHQLGNKATRIIDAKLGKFENSLAAWTYRMQVGPAAEIMIRNISHVVSQTALKTFAN